MGIYFVRQELKERNNSDGGRCLSPHLVLMTLGGEWGPVTLREERTREGEGDGLFIFPLFLHVSLPSLLTRGSCHRHISHSTRSYLSGTWGTTPIPSWSVTGSVPVRSATHGNGFRSSSPTLGRTSTSDRNAPSPSRDYRRRTSSNGNSSGRCSPTRKTTVLVVTERSRGGSLSTRPVPQESSVRPFRSPSTQRETRGPVLFPISLTVETQIEKGKTPRQIETGGDRRWTPHSATSPRRNRGTQGTSAASASRRSGTVLRTARTRKTTRDPSLPLRRGKGPRGVSGLRECQV